jgi:cell wall-associated NlpC family hydrolase
MLNRSHLEKVFWPNLSVRILDIPAYACSHWRLSLVLLLVCLLAGCTPLIVLDDVPPASPPDYEEDYTPPPETSQHPPQETQVSQLPTIQFTIQVGAFSMVSRAARYADYLEQNGLDAYYFVDDDGLYKVRFERFESKTAARSRAQSLQASGLIENFYIVQPRGVAPTMDIQAALRSDLVETVRRFIGTPYRWGGASVRDGFDCSGLTMTVYRLNGMQLPRRARAQFQAGTPVARDDLQKGDLVFFATNRGRYVSHVGVYIGQGKFIHAPGRGKHIRTASLDNSYFKRRYMGARTYL